MHGGKSEENRKKTMKEFLMGGASWFPNQSNWMAYVLSIAGYIYSQVRSHCQAVAPTLFPSIHPGAADSTFFLEDDVVKTKAKMKAHVERLREELIRMGYSPTSGGDVGKPSSLPSEKERCNLQQLEELVDEEFEIPSPSRSATTWNGGRSLLEKRILEIGDMVSSLHEREKNLELQLIRYCGRKEQQATVMNLENNLRISDMEGKLLGLRVDSMEVENNTLRVHLDNCEANLEVEKGKVTELQLRCEDLTSENGRLAHENTSLRDELRSTKLHLLRASASGHSDYYYSLQSTPLNAEQGNADDDDDDYDDDDDDQLKRQNEQLSKEVERLRTDHCTNLEQLVYLRWVNACLRHELREHKPPPGTTTARDLNHNLSHTSRDRAKQLVLQYADSSTTNPDRQSTSMLPPRSPQPKLIQQPATTNSIDAGNGNGNCGNGNYGNGDDNSYGSGNGNGNGNHSNGSGSRGNSSASKPPKFFGKLKNFVTRKSARANGNKGRAVESPTSRPSSSSSSSGSSRGCLSIDCEEPKRVPMKCKSDLGASGKYARMDAASKQNVEAAAAAATDGSKLAKFAVALKQTGNHSREVGRSSSFTISA